MNRRIWLVLALTVLILIGLETLPWGIRNISWWIHGQMSRTNYPGVLLVTPVWLVLLPLSLLTIWRRSIGGRLSATAGSCGVIGCLTTPCAWERVNRAGFLWGLAMSAIAALLGFWLSRKPWVQNDPEENIR